jgi:hypothetical protein
MTNHVIIASQDNDADLNGFEWKDNPAKNFASDPVCFSSNKWKVTFEAADEMGFCSPKVKGGDMEKALAAWEKHPLAKASPSVKAVDLTQKRKEATKLLAHVAKNAEKLAAANPDSHTEFLRYIAYLRRTAHEKIAEFQRQQDETTFQVTKGIDGDSWKATYDAAVNVSAIPKDDKAFKELEKAFNSYAKDIAAMEKSQTGNKPKEAYANALKAKSEAAGVHKALSHVAGTEGWSNETLGKYIDDVRDEVQQESEKGRIAEVLGGKNANFAKQSFDFKNKGGWQDVKKAAISAGLAADAKSGFGELIEKYLKADKKRSEVEKKKDKKPDAYKKSLGVVIAKLKSIQSVATQMEKQTQNANYIAYFQDAGKQCREKIEAMEKSRAA